MNNFEDSIARMKALYTYGTVNENKKQSNSTLEYSAKAADGKYYGIVKECSHFYIKQATEGKEKLAEGYNYIGGYMNKNNYCYDSYNNALKHFELKLASINEAHDASVNVSTLDPFKKEIVIAEATDKMKNEIARQRQIMYNAGMIMNESADYAVKGGAACCTSQPEAETGEKGDKIEGSKEAKAEPEYKGSKVGLEKKAEPFKENPSKAKDLKESCENGSCDTDFDEGMDKGEEPKNVGWDIDNQEKVNEEDEKDWDKGIPASAGVGEADTKENNKPFDKTVNEDVEDNVDIDSEDSDIDDNLSDVEDIDDLGDEDIDDLDDIDDLGDEDFEGIEDNEEVPADEEEITAVEDVPGEGEEIEDVKVDETDPESIKSEIERLQALLDSMEAGEGEDVPEGEDEPEDLEGEDVPEGEDEFSEEDFNSEEDVPEDEDTFDSDETEDAVVDDDEFKFEGKSNFMKNIVESVVKQLKEEELHDFGKHPGYRKKPMNLPPTGEDKNTHGEDINDESVHNEQPFGEKIGDSFPFNELVNAVTKDVMYQLKHGVKIENDKKKVE